MAMRTTGGHRGRRGAGVAALLGALLGGCVVSPQPSPPVHEPFLDAGLVGVSGDPMTLRNQVAIEGKPGAIQPAEGVVVVTNLDSADAPVVAEIKANGSFLATVDASTEQVLRIQVKQGDRRSAPVDLQLAGEPIDATRTMLAHLPCLEIEPDAWVSLEGETATTDVVVRNTCADDVSIGAPRLRRGAGPFGVSPAAAFVVPAGESAVVTVRADGAGDEREDVLFLEVTAPEPGRRVLTLTLPD
ncbi:hypothetical protein [Sorangium sp. So ce1000]|uniref:hypothetical protein n=1 Tax=Sorangium sp. So ce1000 TaxID=3133325 RepID=UPI003F63517A